MDRTTNKNIIWATENYIKYGKDYNIKHKINIEKITGYNWNVIKPRIKKSKAEQTHITKDKGEVFTPYWVCNNMNKLVDEARLYKSAFNKKIKIELGKINKIKNQI